MTNEYRPQPGTWEESVYLALRDIPKHAAYLQQIYAGVQHNERRPDFP
jgi:hypothetical protein